VVMLLLCRLLLLLLRLTKPSRDSGDAVAKATETPRGVDVMIGHSLLSDVVSRRRDVSGCW